MLGNVEIYLKRQIGNALKARHTVYAETEPGHP